MNNKTAPQGARTDRRDEIMFKTLLVFLAIILLVVGVWYVRQETGSSVDAGASIQNPDEIKAIASGSPGNTIHGRVTTNQGAVYEGRIRFGGAEEAFWGDYFNGVKAENVWVDNVPEKALSVRRPIEIFGLTFPGWEEEIDLVRPFMVRFGDIHTIENLGGARIRVQMKSGRQTLLNANDLGDFDDGVRIWDMSQGIMDVDRNQIARIDFMPPSATGLDEPRLWGAVETTAGRFEGYIQWNREKGHGLDVLTGEVGGVQQVIGFAAMSGVERMDDGRCVVTMAGGDTYVMSGGTYDGCGNRGLYIDDARYGRVLVSWSAFVRIDLQLVRTGPEYNDFPQGQPLWGWVVDSVGNRAEGRIVFDLDEDETTDTLDAPRGEVNFSIPFGAVAQVSPRGDPHALVTLNSGEVVALEHGGDLSRENGGLLVFEEGDSNPKYVAWRNVELIGLSPNRR